MRDAGKTKEQLLREMEAIRQRLAELEAPEAERKQTEEALRESEAELATIFDNAPIVMILVDQERRVRKVNYNAVKFAKRAAEEMIGLYGGEALRCIHSSDDPRGCGFGLYCKGCPIRRIVLRTFKTRKTHYRVEAKLQFVSRRGDVVVLVSTALLNLEEGERVLVCIEDITERKQAEEALRESHDYLERLTNSMWDAVFSVKMPERVIEWANDSFRLIGYEPEECVGRNTAFLYPDESGFLEFGNKLKKTMAEGKDVLHTEQLLKRKSGEVFPAEVTVTFHKEKGEVVHVTSIVRDITERKQDRERIEHLNLILRAIRNVNQLITKEKDRDRLLKGICRNLIATRGYYNTWIILLDESGKLVTHAETGLGKDFLPMVERLKLGELPPCARQALEQSAVVVTEDPDSTCTDCPLSHTCAAGIRALAVRLEYGERVYGLLSASIPTAFITDEEVTLFQDVASDIAFALHNIELEEARQRAEEKAREAETLRELDRLRTELLANISHELRTPLASIKGYTTMLLDYDRKLKRDEKRGYLETINDNTDRLAELIEQLLDMSRLGAGILAIDKKPATINKLCREVIAEAQVRSPTHHIVLDLPKRLPRVNIDARHIRQVMDNLIDNAAKYSEAGTEVVVAVRRVGHELLVSVADRGIGIPEKDLSRVFERMFRSRPSLIPGEGGVGLGLSICKGLVEAHGGRIWMESAEGKGTRCFFTLPIYTAKLKISP